jgi:peptide/nickel transport system permease protein
MTRAVLLRLSTALLLLLGLSIAGFLLVHWMPGDVAAQLVSQQYDGAMPSEAIVAAYRAEHGLGDPLPLQYLRWLGEAARLDFGSSLTTGNPAAEEVMQRLWYSLILGVAGMRQRGRAHCSTRTA